MCHGLSSSREAAHIPTFLSKRISSFRSADLNPAIVSSMSIACFWKARSIKLRPVSVSWTILLRPSFGSDVLRSNFLDSRRSTAAVIEALVSRTFFPRCLPAAVPCAEAPPRRRSLNGQDPKRTRFERHSLRSPSRPATTPGRLASLIPRAALDCDSPTSILQHSQLSIILDVELSSYLL